MVKSKITFFLLLCFLFIQNSRSQCGYIPLTVNNPSFEGPQQPHLTPPGWDICMPGTTPDTQPGSWTITLPPSNGSSYLGLVHDPGIPWQEGAGQTLSSPMIAGTDYEFTIDLATSNVSGYGITPGPVELQLWGGWSGGNGCSQVELLWHSGNVTNLTWQTVTLSFTPSANYDHILFLISALDPNYSPYIMLDNMTPIMPVSDVPYYTYQSTSPAQDYCQGVTIQFTDSSYSPAGNTILAWRWDFGDGSPASTLRNPAHTYPNPGTYHVTLEITDDIPCTFTVSRDIIVYAYPVASFFTDSVCIGDATTFTNTSTVDGAPYSGNQFLWSFGDGNTDASSLHTLYFYSNPGQYNATLMVSSNGCSNSVTQTVTVFPYPIVDLGPDRAFCGGTILTLDAGNPGATYLWSDNSTGRYLDVSTPGTYSVTVTSGNNCSASNDVYVDFYPSAQVSVSPTDSSLCVGDSLIVTVTGTTDIQWHPGRWLSDSTAGIVQIKPYTSTIYTIIGTNMYNCTDTAHVRITANAIPDIDLGSDIVLCEISSYILRGPNITYTYIWQDGSTEQTYTATAPGVYWVEANNNGCKLSDSITIFPCTDIYFPSAFTPDGNLLNDYFYGIPTNYFSMADFNLTIYDRWGGIIYESDHITDQWDGTMKGENCDVGTYVWICTFTVHGIDGKNIKYKKQGSVTLIR